MPYPETRQLGAAALATRPDDTAPYNGQQGDHESSAALTAAQLVRQTACEDLPTSGQPQDGEGPDAPSLAHIAYTDPDANCSPSYVGGAFAVTHTTP